jgi:LCP family protein required for cell wall assembly
VLRRPAIPASALRRWLRLAGRIGLALVSTTTLILTGYAWTLSRELNASPTTSAGLDHPRSADRVGSAGSRPTAAIGPTNVLLVGLDSRTDAQGHPLPPEVLTALHAGGDDGEVNTDALLLVHVPTESSQPTIAVSIPRDSYVTVPGFGAHKINSAYHQEVVKATSTLAAQGINRPQLDRLARQAGRRELIQTVEQLTGLTVDHYAEINLAGFYEITQAVGGVPICLTAPVHDSYTGADFPAGPQTVSGAAALAFVRQRHGLPRGDLDRILLPARRSPRCASPRSTPAPASRCFSSRPRSLWWPSRSRSGRQSATYRSGPSLSAPMPLPASRSKVRTLLRMTL